MTMVGQYEIRELLGAGGIGQVHAAFDTILEREVAIKSLRPELLNDKSFVDRFRGEATSLAKLTHPNITTLYNLLADGGNLYLIMECVRGETLEDLLKKRGGKLGVRESLAIIAQVADGLSYAHSLGIVHRDIKPANLMITTSGAVKIMDFGIARVAGSQRLTRDGGALGTLAYMSPEQVRGEEPDGRSDIYSLAITLYEMLSGSVPFEADTDYALMQAHIKTRAPKLSSRLPGVDARIEAALARGLAKNPDQRFAKAWELSEALGAAALRTDAPKIVYDGTRLINTPAPEPAAAAAPRSAPARVLASVVDRLTFVRPDLRLPVVIGAGGSALLALAIALVVILTPIGGSSPASVATARPAPSTGHPGSTPNGSSDPATGGVKVTVATPEAPATTPGTPSKTVPGGNAKPPAAAAPTGLADIIQAATRGDPAAENALGVKYAQGADGLPRDDTQAVAWYRKAAIQGYAGAETNLGDMYLSGRGGLDQNALEALSWYLKAANQNWPDAQYRLGFMYETGLGTAKDLQRAVSLYRSAADNGYPDAQNLLGVFYATGGDGLPHDDNQAVDWYRKAAEQGFAKAEKNLGDMYFFGRGVGQQDYATAITWYKKAADQNFAEAQFRLGFMYEKGLGTAQSDQDAIAFYKKAASNGNVDAQHALDRLSAAVGASK